MGHLCLILSPTVYTTLLATQVVPPPNTGATLVILTGATGPKAASLCYTHNPETITFNMFQKMDHALRQQLMGAVEDNFVHVLYRPHRGYSGSNTLYLLTHL